MVGEEDLVATYEGGFCVTNDMMDVWRNPEDRHVRQWEGRFILGEGFTRHMKRVIRGVLQKYKLSAADIAKVIFPAPDPRTHQGLLKTLDFKEDQAQEPLLLTVGH